MAEKGERREALLPRGSDDDSDWPQWPRSEASAARLPCLGGSSSDWFLMAPACPEPGPRGRSGGLTRNSAQRTGAEQEAWRSAGAC